MSQGYNPIESWQPVFLTGTAYTVSVPQALDAGTPVSSIVLPVGAAYGTMKDASPGVSGDPRQKLTIGCAGMQVRVELVGTGTEDVEFEVFPRDPHNQSFEVESAILGVTYAKGATTPYRQVFDIKVEEVGPGCNLKFTRATGTGNMTVAAWIKRYRYYD